MTDLRRASQDARVTGRCVLCAAVARGLQRTCQKPCVSRFVWNLADAKNNVHCTTCQLVVETFETEKHHRIFNAYRMYDAYLVSYGSRRAPQWKLQVMLQRDIHLSDIILEDFLHETVNGLDFETPGHLRAGVSKNNSEDGSTKPSVTESEEISGSIKEVSWCLGHPAATLTFGFVKGVYKRSVFSASIDLGLITDWVRTCDESHKGRCHSIEDPWTVVDRIAAITLIDVEQQCLVSPEDPVRYLALSYVWGNETRPFQTIKSNTEEIFKPGAFRQPENHCRVPKSILDSMLLARLVGVQFLWVDRFCIVQDDDKGKHDQLKTMASIYVNAYFTIVAAGFTDEDLGLPGISPQRPRQNPYRRFQWMPNCHMVQSDPITAEIEPHYFTRGWTFQEWTLSRRRLVFHRGTVDWICQKHIEQENGLEREDNCLVEQDWTRLFSPTWSRWPNNYAYLNKVQNYMARYLTYSEDVLNAFEAFITVFGRTMHGGILYGIPELFFGSTLLWAPGWGGVRRRVDSHGRIMNELPSWSWVGWKGNIDTAEAGFASDCTDSTICTDFPVVNFYKVPASTATAARPAGRVRIQDLHFYQDKGSTHDMDHSLLPPDESGLPKRFSRFFPLVETPDAVPTSRDCTWSNVIEFRTYRLTAFSTRILEPGRDGPWLQRPNYWLFASDGTIAGLLHLPMDDSNSFVPAHPLELISIGFIEARDLRRRISEASYFHRDCPGTTDPCYDCKLEPGWSLRYYNVMWIEWEDGIAYRKAIGKVWEDCWDGANPEGIDVRLG